MELNTCLKYKMLRNDDARIRGRRPLGPIAAEIDHDEAYFTPGGDGADARPQHFGLQAPPEYGGAGPDSVSYAVVIMRNCHRYQPGSVLLGAPRLLGERN